MARNYIDLYTFIHWLIIECTQIRPLLLITHQEGLSFINRCIGLGILCGDGSMVKVCDHGCEVNATCTTMPEAVCIPDPCTCQPKFYHPDTFHTVNCDIGMDDIRCSV